MISLPMENLRPNPTAVGSITMTLTVDKWIDQNPTVFHEIHSNLLRYLDGDWGNISIDDWELNNDTIRFKTPAGRLMGSYGLDNGETMWIITDGYGRQEEGIDCCYTTILSPDDY